MRNTLSLGNRLRLILAGVVSAVVIVVSALFVYSLEANAQSAIERQTAQMQDALRSKGLAIAANVALTSGRAMATRNFSFLFDVIDTAVKQDDEFVYGIIMDNDHRALVHTNPKLASSVLNAPEDVFAANQTAPATQFVNLGGQRLLEVVAPVFAADQHWGTVRFALSLRNLEREIAAYKKEARAQILKAIGASLLTAVILMLVGSIYGSRASTRLVEPVSSLMRGARRVREGDFATPVTVQGVPEFVALAGSFNEMAFAVKQRENALEGALHAAEATNQLKSEFLANVSHELRTPLNAIINMPRALLKDYNTMLLWHCNACGKNFELDPESQGDLAQQHESCPNCQTTLFLQTRAFFKGDPSQHYHFLQRTLQSATHLLAVVTDVLDFSKLDAGKMEVNVADVDISRTLEDVRDIVTPLSAERGVTLHFPPSAAFAGQTMWADPTKLSQILINLFSNSIKFTEPGGRVTLTVTPHSDAERACLDFAIEDTGIGIPQDKLETIFESFRQVDGGHTRAHGGTGLGLTITRRLCELHEGTVWAESELGKWSRFTVRLPKAGPKAAALAEPGPASDVRFTGRIMVVDDDQAHLELLEHVLVSVGYEVASISDANRALSTLNAEPVEAVVLDIMMPDVSGLTILRAIKAAKGTENIPVIVSSAYHSNKDIVQSLGGIWLPKPWGAEELLACLQKHARAPADRKVA